MTVTRPARARVAGAALLAALALGAGACGKSASDTYGSLPGFLPASTGHPDSALTGTVARPAITSEGDQVVARVGGRSVVVTVTGPAVPGEGLPYQARATTCTWTVTLAHATGPIRLAARDWTTLDHLGTVYRTAYVPGRRRPPAVLRPGQRVTFELRTVMETGEGLMRWAPDGVHIVAKWDFEVETD